MNERLTTVGVYDSAQAAAEAYGRLRARLREATSSERAALVELLRPGRSPERLITQAEHRRARGSLIRCHFVGAAIGLAAGALLALVTGLVMPMTQMSAAAFWTASLWFGLAIGLMAGGAWFLAPATSLVWSRVRDESRAGRWQVIATTRRDVADGVVRSVLGETAADTFSSPGR